MIISLPQVGSMDVRAKKIEILIVLLTICAVVLFLTNALVFGRILELQQNIIDLTLGSTGNRQVTQVGLPIGSKAPDVPLRSMDGHKALISDFFGENLVLIFASTTCPHCTDMYPNLIQVINEYVNYQALLVIKGAPEEIEGLCEKYDFIFPIVQNTDEIESSFIVPGTPFFTIIDSNGVIANKGFAKTAEEIRALLDGSY